MSKDDEQQVIITAVIWVAEVFTMRASLRNHLFGREERYEVCLVSDQPWPAELEHGRWRVTFMRDKDFAEGQSTRSGQEPMLGSGEAQSAIAKARGDK